MAEEKASNITASKSKKLSIGASSLDVSKYTLLAQLEETKTDNTTNTSTIKVIGRITSNNFSFSGTKCELKVYWYDDNENSEGKLIASTSFSSMGADVSKTVSGNVVAKHKLDGTLNGYVKTVWKRSSANSYCPASNNVSTNETALTNTIPVEFSATYEVGDSLTKTLTGVSNKVINDVSKIKINTTASNVPSGVKYFYHYSNENVETTATSYTFTTPYNKTTRILSCGLTLEGVPLIEKTLTGYTDSQIINYTRPYYNNIVCKRTYSTSTSVKVQFTGHIWYGNFGAVQNNQVIINIKYKRGSDANYTTNSTTKNVTSNSFTHELTITNVPTTTDLEVIIEIKDKASSNGANEKLVVPRSESEFDIGSDFFNFNGDILHKGVNILEYENGDTYSLHTFVSGGFVTGSGKNFNIGTIFTPKSLKKINSITLNSGGTIIIRQNNKYLVGTADVGATMTSSNCHIEKEGDNAMIIYFDVTKAPSGIINNDAIGVIVSNLSLTFNE